jgi:hypothetical protein
VLALCVLGVCQVSGQLTRCLVSCMPCRYACQIYEYAKQQLPGLEQQIAAGDFAPLKVSAVITVSCSSTYLL